MQLQHKTRINRITNFIHWYQYWTHLQYFIIKSLYVLMLIMFVLSNNKGFQLVFNSVIAMPPIARIRIKYKGRKVYVKIAFMALKVQPSKICKSRKSPNNFFYCLSFIFCVFSWYRNNEQHSYANEWKNNYHIPSYLPISC